jgi:hypothetical protein
VVLKTEPSHHRVKAVWEPAEVKAGDQAKVPGGGRLKAEALDKAAVSSLNIN